MYLSMMLVVEILIHGCCSHYHYFKISACLIGELQG